MRKILQKYLTSAVSDSIIEQILYIKALKKNGQDGYIQRVGGWCEPIYMELAPLPSEPES